MRKSSLGRRSSTQIPIRLSNVGGSSGQKVCTGARKRSGSLIRQPGFSQQLKPNNMRSQSADRESIGDSGRRSTLVRSNTSGALPGRGLGTMTPITPRLSFRGNLPGTGSSRPSRTESMDSSRRMSSMGGKNTRKDPRPISEKSFQQTAQAKVQKYFDIYGADVIGQGQNIKPMSNSNFINMVDHLFKYFDGRIVITKTNYLEELPILLRKIGYKLKVDRSWLMTVNTPHSWQHVIALLSWLVDSIEALECIDPLKVMYNDLGIDEKPDNDDPEDDGMAINGEVLEYLRNAYAVHLEDPAGSDERVERMEDEFLQRKIVDEKLTDEDFEVVDRQIEVIAEEIYKEEEKLSSKLQNKQFLAEKLNALLSDTMSCERFIEESRNFISTTKARLVAMDQETSAQKTLLKKKSEELERIMEKVKGQALSMEEKDKLTSEKHELLRAIQFHENSIREYEKSSFTVDLKLAEDQRKLDNLLVEYRKTIAENIALEPRLKEVNLNITDFQLDSDAPKIIDDNLKQMKEEFKLAISEYNSKKEEFENFLKRANQDMKETEESILRERTLLEGVESDLEHQRELVEKEKQKLKSELAHYEKSTKEIMDELSGFDPSKLEEKKAELKKMQHDNKLLDAKIEKLHSELLAAFRDARASNKGCEEHVQKLRKKIQEQLKK